MLEVLSDQCRSKARGYGLFPEVIFRVQNPLVKKRLSKAMKGDKERFSFF